MKLKRTAKLSAGVLAVAFIAIQFIHPAPNVAPPGPQPNDLATLHAAPPAVRTILAKACYDCHSDTTRYPWYASVQPVAWWLDHHISEGKSALNFSQFGAYSEKRAARKLEEILDELHERGMPLRSYTLIHRDAQLSDAEVKTLTDWIESIQ
ncbi:MAG: heme-binding domain-containing protein [Verrucomicrobia bacterium]|nr:heme-binding domain-containing protein [Verrucomicrobiota bacterium]